MTWGQSFMSPEIKVALGSTLPREASRRALVTGRSAGEQGSGRERDPPETGVDQTRIHGRYTTSINTRERS